MIDPQKESIIPVILAGGMGTRLWPSSREEWPKQFVTTFADESLFQRTLQRVDRLAIYGAPLVITNHKYRFLVAEQALECNIALQGILLEPVLRNTAPAILAACAYLEQKCGSSQMVHVLPADHHLDDGALYETALTHAVQSAKAGRLVTFGIKPTKPATSYGYIKAAALSGESAVPVETFKEKPDAPTAERFYEAEDYFWNSGMFLFETSILLAEGAKLAKPVHDAAIESVKRAVQDLDFVRLESTFFETSPSISVDYAIFEKTDRASMVPSSFAWSDLGAWDAIWEISDKDVKGNAVFGDAALDNTENTLVIAQNHFVAVNGISNAIIVHTDDATYVGTLAGAQTVGKLVKQLKASNETTALATNHTTSYRPWGGYTSVLKGDRFQVKRLFVKPGKSLSLQKHHHRSEHWIVVKGTALVEIEGVETMLFENQSIYIPQGAVHRLSNSGKILLELIETQTGSYLEEDDIVRLSDEFGRVSKD